MIALSDLLSDQRVRVLLSAARHAHSSLTFDVTLRTQRKCAENLEFALKAFEEEDRETLPNFEAVR